jgi:hypothetical protein
MALFVVGEWSPDKTLLSFSSGLPLFRLAVRPSVPSPECLLYVVVVNLCFHAGH